MVFEELVGKEFPFYGIDGMCFKLGDTVWEAIEDPSDGYRSYMDSIEVFEGNKIFFPSPVATVRIEEYNERKKESWDRDKGFRLVDVSDGHVWLEVGTDAYDDWYPCAVFRYSPKEEALQ